MIEAFKAHWRLLVQPRMTTLFIWWNLFVPSQPLQPGTSWGVSMERDVVNSQLSLQQGLTYTALALYRYTSAVAQLTVPW